MTREEAIDILQHHWTQIINPDYTDEEVNEALNIAIKALQEPVSDVSELDKLEKYLKEHGIRYEREERKEDAFGYDRHQIIVFDNNGERQWDAICHKGSYGYEEGLLEIYGSLVNREVDGNSVVGWLTAEDVIERIENKHQCTNCGAKMQR